MLDEILCKTFENGPKWRILVAYIMTGILFVALFAISIALPPYLAVVKRSMGWLLLWSIPIGIAVGVKAFNEDY